MSSMAADGFPLISTMLDCLPAASDPMGRASPVRAAKTPVRRIEASTRPLSKELISARPAHMMGWP